MVWPAIMLTEQPDRQADRAHAVGEDLDRHQERQHRLGRPVRHEEVQEVRAVDTRSRCTVTPIQTAIAMAKVTMMWLVKVKLPGIMPSMLPIRMNMKMVKIDREEAHALLAGGVAQ